MTLLDAPPAGPAVPRQPGPATDTSPRPDTPALRYDATVPRQLVHRASVAEVFLTDAVQAGDDRFAVAAQLPRGHVVAEDAPHYDPLLVVETVRQAGVLVAHRWYGVPVGTPFVFRSLDFRVDDPDGTRIGTAPARLAMDLSVVPERTRNGRLQGLTFGGRGTLDGDTCLSGQGRLVFLSPTAYRALRERGRRARLETQVPVSARLQPAEPAAVGRTDRRNVVITTPARLADGALAATVHVDTTHPWLFDHALDHVPGVLELEAARQVAVSAVASTYGLAPDGLVVVGLSADLGDFAELDVMTRVTAETGELAHDTTRQRHVAPVAVTVRQGAAVVATARVEVAA